MKTRLFLLFIMCLFILPSASAQQKEYSLWYSQPAPNEGAENIVKTISPNICHKGIRDSLQCFQLLH